MHDVPSSQLERVTREIRAIPFDARGVESRHGQDGRHSIEWFILKQGLKEPALLRLAKKFHADYVSEETDANPMARGLAAIGTGISLPDPEDEEHVPEELAVYGAFHGSCKLEVANEH